MRTVTHARLLLVAASTAACFSKAPEGLAPSAPADTTVKYDWFHKPLPEIPLPNDVATRHDPTSATGLRVNASMVAATKLERGVRSRIDELDGWGTFQPIVIPFTGPLSIESITAAHRDDNYGLADDVVYLVNVDPQSERYGKVEYLDVGNGNYPVVLEKMDAYWKNDPRGHTITLGFEETDEDRNANGQLDPGEDANGNGTLDPGEDADADGVLDPPEDTDADGQLDKPNYYPGTDTTQLLDANGIPLPGKLKERADATMTFYEAQTNTLILRPMEPLDERTTYAVVITKRLKDANGKSVGSPFPFIHHAAQEEALRPLLDKLPAGIKLDDIAFAFTYTTQTTDSAMVAIRDGLYGQGVQKHFAEEFPAKLATIEKMRDPAKFPGMKNAYVVYGEQWAEAFKEISVGLAGEREGTARFTSTMEALQYIDYVVIGSIDSPQLFERFDAEGKFLPLDEQSWPADIASVKAKTRSERVYFTLTVPRKEISARGEGKPAPLILQGHGYGSNRFEGLQLAGYFARQGFATLAIDGPSHGIGLDQIEASLADGIFNGFGLRPMGQALLTDRSYNWDNDPLNRKDSAVDFWTAYLFHTRDVVRQYTLDWMQVVRVIRSFDGTAKWDYDVDGDGTNELAGDFDADGVVDIGKETELHMVGGSLGGLISQMVGSLEPEITAIAPIAGGAGFADMGIRTTQGGAVEGFILRAMTPIFVGTNEAEGMKLETIIPDMNRTGTRHFATVETMNPWDTMVVENLVNGDRGCGYVSADGKVRASVESDAGDTLKVSFYAGPQLVHGDKDCTVKPGATAKKVVETFEKKVDFQWDAENQSISFLVGDPLVALADGFALRRAHPDLRRFQGLGQLVLDAADPGTFARHLSKRPLKYPATNTETGTHAMVVTTLGDLAVPANTGVAYGRAAGFIDYLNDDPRFGKPMNQVLLDTGVAEAVHTLGRYFSPGGDPLHLDVENFSLGQDVFGADVPRAPVSPHIGLTSTDPLGGISASIFPFPEPHGAHGFDMPGEMTDAFRRKAGCASGCSTELPADNVCSCAARPFDIGKFMFNMLGGYLKSGGKTVSLDHCNSREDCEGMLPPPAARSGAAIDAPTPP